MDLPFAILTCVTLFTSLLLFLCYKNAMKKVKGFPFSHLILKLAYNHFTGKTPKDIPLTAYGLQQLIKVSEQYYKEGICMMYVSRPTLFVFSEEAIKFFLNEKAARDKPPEYDVITEAMGLGLGTSNGERWRTHRKMINPAFYMAMLKGKVPLFNKHALGLVKDTEKMAEESSVDLNDALKLNYFKALSESIFGLEQGEENRKELMRGFFLVDNLGRMTAKRLMYPWLRPIFLLPFSAFGRKFLKLNKEAKNFTTKVIMDMKKHVAYNKSGENSVPTNTDAISHKFSSQLEKSFTYILLKHHLSDPSFTFQDVHDEVATMLSAGYDTITYVTLWCLFMLGHHPEVQEKAFEEVQATTSGEYITYEDSFNLSYLEAVIMESLRLFPTVPIFGRNISEDVQFGKYKVYKGTTILFSPYVSHRIPDVYPNPENFEPERFLNGGTKGGGTFFPFSGGNRICIGKNYAIIEMKIFLAHFIRNFRFMSLDKREDIHPCWGIALTPSRHIHMKITSRKDDEIYINKEKDS